jgi:hypothetical protein
MDRVLLRASRLDIRRAIRAALVSALLARLAVGHKSGCYKGAQKQKGGGGISVGVDKIRD